MTHVDDWFRGCALYTILIGTYMIGHYLCVPALTLLPILSL